MTVKEIFAQHHILIQETSYTCGPCSVLNILRLKGSVTFHEAELAKLCDATPNIGTSHEHIVELASQVGLELLEVKSHASFEDIEHNIDSGGYVIINYIEPFSGDGHYAVVTEYDDDFLYLHDCWLGLIRVQKKDLLKLWHDKSENVSVPRWFMAVR
jgi:predicted double-glycine peptidase